jgi:hypothetical protein
MRRALTVAVIASMLIGLLAVDAAADRVYHSEQIALAPVGGSPLRTGFVENIHANGPQIFAMERYVLNGAAPNTTYDVALHISVADPTCSSVDAVLPTATVTTGPVGNGVGMVTLPPSAADGLHGLTIHIVWVVSAGGSSAYETACTAVTLD